MFDPPMDDGPSSAKDEVLEYVRAEFGSGWEPVLIYDEGMADAADPLGWRVEVHHVSNGSYFTGVYTWDPMSAARACVEAWREATTALRENLEFRENDLAVSRARENAEREHADRLAEALRELADSFATFDASDETNDLVLAALTAHDARRAGEGGSR